MWASRLLRRAALTAVLVAIASPAAAQVWTAPKTWVTGELVTSSQLNTHIRDNELVLRAGGISVTSQAAGDLMCASSATQLGRVAAGTAGLPLLGGGAATCPSYGKIAAISSTYFTSLDGSALTSLAAANLTGTIADARLSANVPLLNAVNTFTGGLQTLQRSTDGSVLDVQNTLTTFTGEALVVHATRAASSVFSLLNLYANGVSQLSVTGDGLLKFGGDVNLYAAGTRTLNANATATTIFGTLTVTGGLSVSRTTNSAWAATFDNSGTTDAHGLYVNIGGSSTGVPFRVDKGGSALLNVSNGGLLTVSGFGTHSFSAGGTGGNIVLIRNTSTGTTDRAVLETLSGTTDARLSAYNQSYTTGTWDKQASASLYSSGTGGLQLVTSAAAALTLWTNGTLRWGINSAGDWTYGASSNIADSVGTPTIVTAVPALFKAGTIAGTDYAFVITNGSGTPSDGSVNFGHTWSTAPVCTVTMSDSSAVYIGSTTTTQLTLVNNTAGVGSKYFVLCRSY